MPDSSSQRGVAAKARAKPAPQASSSPRWCASSATISVRAPHCGAQRAADDATRAYVAAMPWKSRGGCSSSESGCRWMPKRAATLAHWWVSGVVGQTTCTRSIVPASSSLRANARLGIVLPAPGAAESRNEP